MQADLFGAVDDAHAAFAEHVEDAVAGDVRQAVILHLAERDAGRADFDHVAVLAAAKPARPSR